ncbi:MAG: hypothetical protein H6Q25_30 [Bacteroidetes bacterium]|nr:hypothetical protein [Bacteroidota bacterium]
MNKIKLLFSVIIFAISLQVNSQSFSFDFTSGDEGWSGDFADYPLTDSILCELEFNRTTLPSPLNTEKFALKISGKNYPDDLFMFIKRKISGLSPSTTYQLLISVEFASIAPTNIAGVGGQPGEGVIVKTGASILEPQKIVSGSYYRMNIDKGQQTTPGVDMDTIGHVGVSDTTTVFTLINRNNATHLFTVTTDENGEVWVCIGSDSGYESTTTLFYNQINLTFSEVVGLSDYNGSQNIIVYPNPTNDWVFVKTNPILVGESYLIANQLGESIISGHLQSEISGINLNGLPSGAYFLIIGNQEKRTFKVIKK